MFLGLNHWDKLNGQPPKNLGWGMRNVFFDLARLELLLNFVCSLWNGQPVFHCTSPSNIFIVFFVLVWIPPVPSHFRTWRLAMSNGNLSRVYQSWTLYHDLCWRCWFEFEPAPVLQKLGTWNAHWQFREIEEFLPTNEHPWRGWKTNIHTEFTSLKENHVFWIDIKSDLFSKGYCKPPSPKLIGHSIKVKLNNFQVPWGIGEWAVCELSN